MFTFRFSSLYGTRFWIRFSMIGVSTLLPKFTFHSQISVLTIIKQYFSFPPFLIYFLTSDPVLFGFPDHIVPRVNITCNQLTFFIV